MIGVAITGTVLTAAGLFGAGKTAHAGINLYQAAQIKRSAEEIHKQALQRKDTESQATSEALQRLGEEKSLVLTGSVSRFLETFRKLKNVEFLQTETEEKLKEAHLDELKPAELNSLIQIASSLVAGSAVSAAGGALAAFGSYSAAQVFACASTGTAISSLSGAAATNATLAFFGGGSLASGGLGMAGGSVILGGIVAVPALVAVGLIADAKTGQNLEQAKIQKAQALEAEEMSIACGKTCQAIRRRICQFYNLLARLDTRLLPLVFKMEDIVEAEGTDYRKLAPESRKIIASCASLTSTISALMKAPILSEEGELTAESGEIAENVTRFLDEPDEV